MRIVLILLVIIGLAITGWIKSIVNLTSCDFKADYKCEVINTVGTFMPPVGSVVGWLNIED